MYHILDYTCTFKEKGRKRWADFNQWVLNDRSRKLGIAYYGAYRKR